VKTGGDATQVRGRDKRWNQGQIGRYSFINALSVSAKNHVPNVACCLDTHSSGLHSDIRSIKYPDGVTPSPMI